jgi:acetylornithine deacetylase/succinyl-diaminopimelate desuccinylase-like protein
VARLRATGPETQPPLVLLSHLDVVPVDAEAWTRDPFGGDLVDGVVWGRGAVDMKNMVAMELGVVLALRRSGAELNRDVIFAAVADEEAGGVHGAHHLVEERWDLVGCDYLLTEVAAPPFRTEHGAVVPVTVAEKGPAWRRVRARGRSGHASQPYARDNALVSLVRAMSRLGTEASPVAISDEWRRFVAAIPADDELRAMLTDPDRVDEAIDTIALTDPPFARWVHACTHMTVAPTVVHAGVKSNVIPDEGVGDVDVRILPGQDQAAVDDHFRKALGPSLSEEVEIESVLEFPANGSPPSGVLWESIADAAETVTGTRSLIPSMTPVSTDARFFRARGVPAYGVGWFDDRLTFGEMLSAFHGVDERVSVDSVGLTTGFLADVVAAFGRRTAPR